MQKFKTKLVGEGPKSAWTFLDVPFDVLKVFGSKARVSVRGTINGFAYRSSIFPDGKGKHRMMANKAMMAGAKAGQGDEVTMTMEVDDAPREVATPADLKKALKGDVKKRFEALSPSSKKEFVDWIEGAKRAETRAARVEKAVARIAAGKRRLDD